MKRGLRDTLQIRRYRQIRQNISPILVVGVSPAIEDGGAEFGAEALGFRIESILQVSRCDTVTLTYSIALLAYVKRLAVPVAGNSAKRALKTIGVASRSASTGVYIRGQTGSHARITDEKDTLDCVKAVSGQLGHGIDGCSRSLRIAFEQEAS